MKDKAQISGMAMEAIENLLMSDDLDGIKESLKEFFLSWIVSDDDPDLDERREKLFHYIVIHGLLKEAEKIRDEIEEHHLIS